MRWRMCEFMTNMRWRMLLMMGSLIVGVPYGVDFVGFDVVVRVETRRASVVIYYDIS